MEYLSSWTTKIKKEGRFGKGGNFHVKKRKSWKRFFIVRKNLVVCVLHLRLRREPYQVEKVLETCKILPENALNLRTNSKNNHAGSYFVDVVLGDTKSKAVFLPNQIPHFFRISSCSKPSITSARSLCLPDSPREILFSCSFSPCVAELFGIPARNKRKTFNY